ncbi:NAD-dependent epimerase/dehydratase family protein [Sulfobacillus harzensis]|nr:NAD-dependent epimerase/dehydratase family protein [Sulfobacillus harzensis]
MMKVLLLGGTHFLGRHLVESALRSGHDVTLFNRGKTAPGLFPKSVELRGDRDGNLDALHGRNWDVVIDTSGYVPRVVRASAELLRPHVGRYVFVSSISVYADFDQEGMDEEFPVGEVEDAATEDVAAFYGPLKALSEAAVQEVYGNDAFIIRPGLIVGPHDPTDRFTYWVRRFGRGDDVLVPGSPARRVQFIDARDLADWMVRAVESGVVGIYNATGPAHPLTMGELVKTLQSAIPNAGRPVWVNEDFLAQHQVEEWTELPLWISEAAGWPGFMAVSIERALGTGLAFRPLTDTIRDTWQWDRDRMEPMKAGMGPEREKALLTEWFQR